jgi:hypothetical protein
VIRVQIKFVSFSFKVARNCGNFSRSLQTKIHANLPVFEDARDTLKQIETDLYGMGISEESSRIAVSLNCSD